MKKITCFYIFLCFLLLCVCCTTQKETVSTSYVASSVFNNGENQIVNELPVATAVETIPIATVIEEDNIPVRETYLYKTINPTCEKSGVKIYRYHDNDEFAYEEEYCPALGHRARMTKGEIDYCSVCKKPVYGLAGGYIFYDIDADNESGNEDGLDSKQCKWRYLEAVTDNLQNKLFGYYRKNSFGDNLFSNGYTSYSIADCTLSAIGYGKENTELLLRNMEGHTYSTFSQNIPVNVFAVKIAGNYKSNGYDDWFLPSADEMIKLYENVYLVYKDKLKINKLNNYWTSTEVDAPWANTVYAMDFINGVLIPAERFFDYGIIPVRRFLHGESEHVWTRVITKYPTCVEFGRAKVLCEPCGKILYESVPVDKTRHSVMANGICRLCGERIRSADAIVDVNVNVVVNN